MARSSGNVYANGTIMSDTSNKNGFTVTARPNGTPAGTYRINFTKTFDEVPTVLVNVINWDAETAANTINIGIVPNTAYVDIEIWRDNNYDELSFAFAAFGNV